MRRRDLIYELQTDYHSALRDLYRAGHTMIHSSQMDQQWFHAQRVIVAVARSKLCQIDPTKRERTRTSEATILLRLRDIANQAAREVSATTRQAKRKRRRLEAMADEWQEMADLLLYGESS